MQMKDQCNRCQEAGVLRHLPLTAAGAQDNRASHLTSLGFSSLLSKMRWS